MPNLRFSSGNFDDEYYDVKAVIVNKTIYSKTKTRPQRFLMKW